MSDALSRATPLSGRGFGRGDGSPTGPRMNLRFLDPIWHIDGSVELAPGQTSDEAFDRLDPLFRERGTTRERIGDTLTFHKENAAPQDKLSIFDDGVLRIEPGETGPVLRYRLASRILLFVFFAPLLFLAFAQLSMFVNKLEEPVTAAEKAEAKAEKAKKEAAKEKLLKLPQNPIDKFLGAPAPELPKKDKKKKDEDEKPKPTAAYIFAGLFAALYVAGRILEAWLVKRLFRKRLLGE